MEQLHFITKLLDIKDPNDFENFKKRIFIALNIKKERTKFVLSRA
ncbi:hypothetical protein [Streptococcus pneumoniae]|nr:hypothetical protein [Streptococcus pneumoniae]